jgi:hypothetical protein
LGWMPGSGLAEQKTGVGKALNFPSVEDRLATPQDEDVDSLCGRDVRSLDLRLRGDDIRAIYDANSAIATSDRRWKRRALLASSRKPVVRHTIVMSRAGSTQKLVVPAPIAPYAPGVDRWPE